MSTLVQLEKWDGSVLHVNDIAAARAIGPTILQLLGMHADVTLFPTLSKRESSQHSANSNKVTFRNYTLSLERRQPHMKI